MLLNKRALWVVLGLAFMVCLILVMSLLSLSKSQSYGTGWGDPTPGNPGISGVNVPGGGNCAHVGKDWDENPFFGWPVEKYRTDDWGTISAWYCDKTYLKAGSKEWIPHWGIDIATYWCHTGECETASIFGAPLVVTTEKAIVKKALAACPSVAANDQRPEPHRCGWPMGNHVIVEALILEEQCELELEQDLDGDGLITGYCQQDWVPSGWEATYMHLNEVAVSEGQEVEAGQILGYVGNTGASSGAHLHYQINHPSEGAVDPAPSMAKSYDDVLRDLYPFQRH